jgi:hypothetical protein
MRLMPQATAVEISTHASVLFFQYTGFIDVFEGERIAPASRRAHSRLARAQQAEGLRKVGVLVLAVASTPPQGFSYLVFAVIEASRTNKPAPRPLLSR